jgi:ATP-dependent DNA helicase DinG
MIVNMITTDDWRSCFPFPTMRKMQEDAINFALDAFIDKDKKFVVLEMGVGCGKSAVGVCIANYIASQQTNPLGSYVLTTQKILQEQYIKDFGPSSRFEKLRSLKSSANYNCTHYPGRTCAESKRTLSVAGEALKGSEFHQHCSGLKCPYTYAKKQFAASKVSLTNFSFFLASAMYTDFITKRDLLVIDESHNTDVEVRKFVQSTFSEQYSKKLNVSYDHTDDQQDAFTWVKEKFYPAMCKRKNELTIKVQEEIDKKNDVSDATSREFEAIDKHLCKLNRFLSEYVESNWVLTALDDKGKRSLEFRPIDVSQHCEDMLYEHAEKVLFMSATIVDIDIFCRNNGLKRSDVAYLSIPSPFDPKNRPVHYTPVGSMAKVAIDATMPKIAEAVKYILEAHKSDKGIIHATTFRIANYIKNNVKSSRLLIHTSEDRDEVLQKHISSNKPTVLISPSMSEGVDLYDDLSRFQILCKIPYPFLGDSLVVKRMNNDKRWYEFETCKTIIQSLGRSVRNENDHAVTYILDSGFERFYNNTKSMFPVEFEQMLVM